MIRDRESAFQVSKMKRLMTYTHASQIEDWNTVIAIATLRAAGSPEELDTVAESCMDRVLAWLDATGDRPWNIEGEL